MIAIHMHISSVTPMRKSESFWGSTRDAKDTSDVKMRRGGKKSAERSGNQLVKRGLVMVSKKKKVTL